MENTNAVAETSHIAPSSFAVTLCWSEFEKGLKIPSIRNADLSLHLPFHTFVLKVATDTSKKPTAFNSRMRPIAYTLFQFAQFLESNSLRWDLVTDSIIVKYRDYALAHTEKSGISRGELTSKQTTNIKLVNIYEFYTWAVHGVTEPTPSIGWEESAQIRSSLPLYDIKRDSWNSHPNRRYPLCYRDAGISSGSMSGQHWATNVERDDIEDFFRSHCPRTAERNILFMQVTDQTGFRRSSTNSLTVGQFSNALITKSQDAALPAHPVQPNRQKFGYRNFFDFPYSLAFEVQRFIKGVYGDDIFKRLDADKKLSKLPIFLSNVTGEPLEDASWSDIFTVAFRAVEAPRGAGIHSFRRKFAEEWFKKEVQRYKDEGKLVSYPDIISALATVLGQDSKLSQEAYRRASNAARRNTPLDMLTCQNNELMARIMQLESQLAVKDTQLSKLMMPEKQMQRQLKKHSRQSKIT